MEHFQGVAWFTNEVALAWIHERVPREENGKPLPDIFFSIFPEITGAIRVTEYIMLLILISAICIIFTHQHRWIVAKRVFFCVALCYFVRAFFICIFQVPVPSEKTYCAPKTGGGIKVIAARVAKMFWSAGIEQLRPRELCGDLIVSGHTIALFNALLTVRQYVPRRLNFIAQLYNILAVIALICILLARKHYTIDIILGYLISTRIFWTYHSLSLSYHDNDFDANPLNQSFWSFVVPYMENEEIPTHKFLNRLQWPSTYPQKIQRRLA
uniref:PAP2_C domain-containing protein n=1 Tax=Syphacia muris TaxID=451379 RepID=A0A0N5AJM2_9BILA